MAKLIAGFLMGVVTVSACASLPVFPFKYYSLDAENYTGTLKGPDASQDVDFKRCLPNSQDAAPCMVMFTASFLKMRDEYLEMKVDLKACEAGQ
jgi:hypothetical protein